MPTFIEILPATKTSKNWGITFIKPEGIEAVCGKLVIESRGTHVEYRLTEFSCGWDGRAFYLTKLTEGTDSESESYDCFVARNGQDKRCDCKGFIYGKGRPCKHLESIAALLANGWI